MDAKTQLKGDIDALLTLIDALKHNGSPEDDLAVRAATLVLSERRAELARLDRQ
jgi:hypothetical protein